MGLGEADHRGKVLFSSRGHVMLNHLLSWMHLGHFLDEDTEVQPGVELEMAMTRLQPIHLPLPHRTISLHSGQGHVMCEPAQNQSV